MLRIRRKGPYSFQLLHLFSAIKVHVFGLFLLTFGLVAGTYLALSGVIMQVFAADITQDWLFASSGDYTVSSGAEVASSTGRHKVQNYTSDASTAALFHFDESSGDPADSSSFAGSATGSNLTYTTGNLNNAGSFNGSTSRVSVADSTALSLTQSMTIEAWTKFDSSWASNNNSTRQTIIDKGTYQLYYDPESGKVTVELAPSNADNWSQVAGPDQANANSAQLNGSWDLNNKPRVESSVLIGTDLYVGLGNGIGDAEVWRCTSCTTAPTWTQIGGDGRNSSWSDGTYEEVSSLATDGTALYAGTGTTAGDAEVWRWDGSSWTRVGGDAINSSWANSTYEVVDSLAVSGTTVYAGLGNSAGDAEVWRCTSCTTSPTWTRIGGDAINSSWANSTYEGVTSMTIVGSNLVAGLSVTAGDAEVWSTDTTTISWTKRGGDGTGSGGQSWGSVFEEVRALTSSGNFLFVGLGTTAGDADVWRCDLSATCSVTAGWTQVGGDALNSSWATSTFERVWNMAVSGTTVYAVIGDTAGDGELWSCSSCTTSPSWSKIGGDGNNTPPQSWNNSFTHTEIVEVSGTVLFAGVGHLSSSIGSEVWSCDTSVACTTTTGWSRIGGQYINNSWGYYNRQSVESMTTLNGKLYAGTGSTVAGNAQVWEYDGSTWTMIGGQGINSSWTLNTYETVPSMTAYGNNLVVGLGSSTGDGEVWSWNGTIWTKIGGDASGTGGQSWGSAYEFILSLAVYGGNLYVGAGSSAGDADVWRCTGSCTATSGWTQVGGDTLNSSWASATYETVQSMTIYNGNLVAGLGASAGDAEVWSYNGTSWSKIGGDGSGSSGQSWATATYEQVNSLAIYNGELYAGLGSSAGDAEVWRCTGSCTVTSGWTAVGGDTLNTSWADATYERVRALAVFNGELYASLGINAGDGEVWKMNATTSWSRVGGDGQNSGWSNVIENVPTLAVYRGKLYAGTGDTANADAMIFAYGNNTILQSTASTQDTDWHHIATTYDGSTLRLYIDGVLDTFTSVSITMLNTVQPLLIGSNYGSHKSGFSAGVFSGLIDELRISSSVRDTFQTTPYSSNAETVQPSAAVYTSGIKSWDGFSTSETLNGGTIGYRLSSDGGTTWRYYSGGAWTTSSSTSETNSATDINTNIGTFPVSTGGFLWQAVLSGNGNQRVTLNSVTMTATSDVVAPSNPDTLSALSASGGSSLTTNTWYPHTAPYFSWSGADDGAGSGIAGYYVYFGTDNTADPSTAGSFQVGTTYTASSLISGSTYYLRIKARDNAQNSASTTFAPFIYKFDGTTPTNPVTVTVSPAGYAPTNDFTFTWPAGSDSGAGIAGYQYKTGAASGTYSDWSATNNILTVSLSNAAYQTDSNTFFLRTVDTAGNVSSPIQALYYYAGEGPSAPQNLAVSPSTNTTNSFAFSWDAPSSHSGLSTTLKYCYTVNTLPSAITCTYTSAGATALSASGFATQTGLNTFYVVAKNADDVGGAINYGAYASISFTANTSAPGIPLNADIADVSVKSTSSWKIALSWEAPSDGGSGVANYQVFRSTDDSTYTKIATTTGIAYVDTGLDQAKYYYQIRACDNVNNCGAFTTAVSLTPTGKFTSAPSLSSGPTVSGITTKKAVIKWSTDRTSDSKVQFGTGAGSYGTSEPSNSKQVTDHEITLNNLEPGTTYYYRARWTDEDGNTGVSGEKSFTTDPAPTISEVAVKNIGLSTAIVQFKSVGASKVKIYFGKTTAFGGVKTIETSTGESTYTAEIDGLEDGTKYYYKINGFDTEAAEYEGTILNFETLPRPKISTVRIQQVRGTAQPTILVTWTTNTPTSSIVTYFPEGQPAAAKDEVNVNLQNGEHRIIIRGLTAETGYTLIVKGRDKAGNEAISDPQKVTTATDTRPPQVTNLKVEGAVQAVSDNSQESVAQLVVSWTTDEPSTSQVEFGEGTGSTYSNKTQEDSTLTVNHMVVITGLTPSKVYHLRALSKDKANNLAQSIDTVTITPKATENALNLVLQNLQQVFGVLGGAR